jgi:hypothetical protein
MTIGQELSALTGFPLFYNHRIIDLVTDYLPYGTPAFDNVVRPFFRNLLRETAGAGCSLIVTWGWRFNLSSDHAAMSSYIEPFLTAGHSVCFAELAAPLETRLVRNRTENRRRHKKVDWATDEELASLHATHRWNTDGDFPFDVPHMILDNTNLEPREAALAIAGRFGLPILSA